MHKGSIVKIFAEKEYGLIQTESGQEALFHTECLWAVRFDELSQGQEVEFELQNSHKGFLAFHVRPLTTNAV